MIPLTDPLDGRPAGSIEARPGCAGSHAAVTLHLPPSGRVLGLDLAAAMALAVSIADSCSPAPMFVRPFDDDDPHRWDALATYNGERSRGERGHDPRWVALMAEEQVRFDAWSRARSIARAEAEGATVIELDGGGILTMLGVAAPQPARRRPWWRRR